MAHIAGSVTNTSQRLWRTPTVIAWFLAEDGRVLDMTSAAFGTSDVQLRASVLRPGQPGPFDVSVSWTGEQTALARQVKTVKALVSVREEDLP